MQDLFEVYMKKHNKKTENIYNCDGKRKKYSLSMGKQIPEEQINEEPTFGSPYLSSLSKIILEQCHIAGSHKDYE